MEITDIKKTKKISSNCWIGHGNGRFLLQFLVLCEIHVKDLLTQTKACALLDAHNTCFLCPQNRGRWYHNMQKTFETRAPVR